MARFALLHLDGGEEIAVTDGKVTIGRGPFLRIIDKRVSRHHAIIEVTGSTMKIIPIHTNPTFHKERGAAKFEPLEKDKPKELQDGNCIAFLPDDLVFQVVRKDNINTTEQSAVEINRAQIDCGEENRLLGKELEEENDLRFKVCKKEKEVLEDPITPLKKTRNLPTWMTNKEDETASKARKKANETRTNKQRTSAEALDLCTSVSEGKIRKDKKEELESVSNNLSELREEVTGTSVQEQEEEEKELSTALKKGGSKKRKRSKRKEKDNGNQETKRGKTLPACPYGAQCYRKNPAHFREYSHDEPTAESGSEKNPSKDENDLPECPYGTSCYRKNPQHRKDYKHTATPEKQKRRARRKPGSGVIDEDDNSPNDYDYEDSFINDESESSGDIAEDSDWQPDGEETGDEDIGQLLFEAEDFKKNKKMMKR